MKFVLHSRERDKIHLLILRRSRSRGFRAGLIGMRHSSQSYFQCRTKFVCNLPDTSEISYQNENFIQIENRNDLYGNKMSFRCHVNKFREIYGDRMNLSEIV